LVFSKIFGTAFEAELTFWTGITIGAGSVALIAIAVGLVLATKLGNEFMKIISRYK